MKTIEEIYIDVIQNNKGGSRQEQIKEGIRFGIEEMREECAKEVAGSMPAFPHKETQFITEFLQKIIDDIRSIEIK